MNTYFNVETYNVECFSSLHAVHSSSVHSMQFNLVFRIAQTASIAVYICRTL